MDSPNSGSLLFLAFWEMPAMDSPSTCGTHSHQLETTARPVLQPQSSPCSASRASVTRRKTLTLEFSMTLSRQLK